VGLVGKAMRLLEKQTMQTKGFFLHPWALYGPMNYSLVKKFKFKIQFQPIKRTQMCCLLFGCSSHMTKQKCDKFKNLQMVFLHFASTWETNH
jgi:hypothetical protein